MTLRHLELVSDRTIDILSINAWSNANRISPTHPEFSTAADKAQPPTPVVPALAGVVIGPMGTTIAARSMTSLLWDLGARPRDDGAGFDCADRNCARGMCTPSTASGKDRSDSSAASGTDRLQSYKNAVSYNTIAMRLSKPDEPPDAGQVFTNPLQLNLKPATIS